MTIPKFNRWVVAQGGATVVAKRLGITYRCVYGWLSGRGSPTFGMAYTLVCAGQGAFTYEELLKSSTRNCK
jgi:DNA-binding phage protein